MQGILPGSVDCRASSLHHAQHLLVAHVLGACVLGLDQGPGVRLAPRELRVDREQGAGDVRRYVEVLELAPKVPSLGLDKSFDGFVEAHLHEPQHEPSLRVASRQPGAAQHYPQDGEPHALAGPCAQSAGRGPQASRSAAGGGQLAEELFYTGGQVHEAPGGRAVGSFSLRQRNSRTRTRWDLPEP